MVGGSLIMAATIRLGPVDGSPADACPPPEAGADVQAASAISTARVTQRHAQASIDLDFDAEDPCRVVLIEVLELLRIQAQLVDVLHGPANEGRAPLGVE